MQGGGGERRREKKTGRDSKEQIPQQPGVVRTILLLIGWGNEYLS